jgi:hypothetical protein
MFKRILILAILATWLIPASAQTKRALIIAIGDYPEPEKNGWRQINASNDVPLIKNALLRQNFPADQIKTLVDAQATKKGIEDALADLVNQTGRGDVVVIHISSHGQQIEDDNLSEEADGLDETIVPWGARYSQDKSLFNIVSNDYLRDDAFGEYVTQIRNRLRKSGDLLVSIDACHSGSGTRGPVAIARGNNSPMVSDDFSRKKLPAGVGADVFKEGTRSKLSDDAATFVVLSGAQAQQLNFECLDDENRPVGSLSYALSKVLSTLEGSITYRSLFAKIEGTMRDKAPRQKPVLEGDGIDRELFGGKYQRQQPYVTINPTLSTETNISLNAGTVAGATVGSSVRFYPAGTAAIEGKEPLARGTVVSAGNFNATVKLDAVSADLVKKRPWGFITETVYGNNRIRLGIDSLNEADKALVQNRLNDFKAVDISPKPELYIGRSESGEGWALRYANSGGLFSEIENLSNGEDLINSLKRYDRFRYLQNLNVSERGLSAKVDVVYLDANGNIDTATLRSRTRFGRLEVQEGDDIFLRIVNTGMRKFYINIVDLQPDGKINPVIPNKRLVDLNNNPAPITADDCKVNPGDTLFFHNLAIHISPPYGEEVFKVFLSGDTLDLEDILTSNDDTNSQTRGVINNLVKVFRASERAPNGTRGGDGKINTAQNGTVFGVPFSIVPAQR